MQIVWGGGIHHFAQLTERLGEGIEETTQSPSLSIIHTPLQIEPAALFLLSNNSLNCIGWTHYPTPPPAHFTKGTLLPPACCRPLCKHLPCLSLIDADFPAEFLCISHFSLLQLDLCHLKKINPIILPFFKRKSSPY